MNEANPLVARNVVPTPSHPEKAGSTHPWLLRRFSSPWAICSQRGYNRACFHPPWGQTSVHQRTQGLWDWKKRAAENVSSQPCSSSIDLGEQTLGFWSLWGCLCPFFGLVIHPSGLEIMTNHNNNSQLNKTSINRNNNWGWEEKWPMGILFRRDFRLWFPRQKKMANQPIWFLSSWERGKPYFPKASCSWSIELTVLQ